MQERETISTQYPQQGSQQPDAQRRTQLAIRAIMFGFVFTIIAAVSYQPLYRQTGAWQILLAVGGITLGTLCLVPALRAARQGQLERAGYWALAAVFATFGIGELAWADATLVQVTSAVALMILAGSIFLPQQWILWGTSISVYIVYTLLVNSVPLWTRFEIIRVQPVTQVTPLPLVLLLIWLIASTLWSRSIRNRLLIGFGVIALLLAPAIGVFSAYRALQDGQDQVAAQLESVATLKEAEIQTWINTLQSHLVTWGTGPDTIPDIRAIQDESMTGSEYWDAYSRLSQQMRQLIYLTGLFEEMLLIDLQGEVILATNPTREGDDYSGETYFSQGMAGPYVEPPYYRPTLDRAPSPSQVSMTFSRPMLDRSGRVVAVLVGRANFETLNALMLERAGLGETGQTYLVGANYAVLTLERKEIGVTFVRTQATEAAIEGGVGGSDIYEGYHGDTVIGVYHWLPELEMVLLAEQDQSEILGTIYETWAINAGLVAVLVLLAIVLALVITRSIAAPLANLAEVTARMAEGELETTAIEAREDEIGKLSQAFDSMTFQMRGLIDSLEHRVAARTQELERRSSFLEASTEVARAAASILDTDRLIEQVVVLIRERFNLYYVGLFLLDEARRWAVMRAGTGEAGQAMLARDHRLEVGDGSMIGWSIANRQARIAQEAGADAVRLATPELPATRSEAALPLQSRADA